MYVIGQMISYFLLTLMIQEETCTSKFKTTLKIGDMIFLVAHINGQLISEIVLLSEKLIKFLFDISVHAYIISQFL